MATTSPVIEWRSPITPTTVISSLPLTGTGSNGAIVVGSSSNIITVRIYNNFAAAATIADATSCVLACYDDTIHQGTAVLVPSINMYLAVQVTDYNGITTSSDLAFFPIGGTTKHRIPVNSAILGGAVANYVTVNIQATIPQNATQGTVLQGVWLEYSSSV